MAAPRRRAPRAIPQHLRNTSASALAHACASARHTVHWRGLEANEADLRRLIEGGDVAGVAAFHALLLPLTCDAQLALIAEQAAAIAWEAAPAPSSSSASPAVPLRHDREQLEPRNRNRPLRIALLRGSANSNADRLATLLSLRTDGFSAHLFTTSLDAASVAALHDTLGDGRRHALRHTSLRPLTDADAAVLLSSFDVVLDASGHTAGNRLGALARRPAPVAASVLGFAGSYGGARLVDYLTADRLVTPPMVAGVARTLPCVATSERVVLLPTTYQPAATAMAARPYGKATRGAAVPTSSRGPLVGSFTRAVRWHPSSFGLWAEVLRRGPRARMWLLAADGDARAGAIAELRAAGVDARRRLTFASYEADKASHVVRHAHLSASIDTTPLYGSHTTATDALAAAVPLFTLPAAAWASRVGTSVAAAAGVTEAAVTSPRELADFSSRLLDGGGEAPWMPTPQRRRRHGDNVVGKEHGMVYDRYRYARAVGLHPNPSAHSGALGGPLPRSFTRIRYR